MQQQDKVLDFLRTSGPTLPSKVAKNINTNILIASAHLSDLKSQGKVKITYMKIGGSPLYYLPGQESQIFPFAAENVNPKDYAVLERLKVDKILRESELDLLSKVALRQLKDFAVPLQVMLAGNREIFWKWFSLSSEETNQIIQQHVGPEIEEQQPVIPEAEPSPSEISSEETLPVVETVSETSAEKDPTSTASEVNVENEPLPPLEIAESIEINIEPEASKVEQLKEEPVKEEKSRVILDKPKVTIKDEPVIEEIKEVAPVEEVKEALIGEPQLDDTTSKLENELNKKVEKPKESSHILEKDTTKPKRKKTKIEDNFLPIISEFFKVKEIIIDQKEIIRKNSEVNFLINVPSVVGTVTYYCKAKKKARVDEKDISAAYMEAQIKRLPLLFIYTKQITSKALEMIETEAFQNVALHKIE